MIVDQEVAITLPSRATQLGLLLEDWPTPSDPG